MTRSKAQHDWELAFLIDTRAWVEEQLSRRVYRLKALAPELADEIDTYVVEPLRSPRALRGHRGTIEQALRGLRLEEQILSELEAQIERIPLAEALEKELRRLEQERLEIERTKRGAGYLLDPRFWADETRIDILNRIIHQWAQWNRQAEGTRLPN